MHTELFVRCMVKKFIVIRMYAKWFKRFKNGDFSISDKERSCSCGRELQKDRKNRGKRIF